MPEGVPVEVDGFVLMGDIDDKTRGHPAAGAPMLRVKAYGMWGGVTVRHPSKRSRRRDGETRATSSAPVPPAPVPTVGSMPAPPLPLEGTTVTLMFTDVIESTSMAQSLGDQRWFEVLQGHNSLLREEFERCGGASRIAACAGIDQILASSVTKELADSGGDLDFDDGRVVDLRGLSGQWRVHEVHWS